MQVARIFLIFLIGIGAVNAQSLEGTYNAKKVMFKSEIQFSENGHFNMISGSAFDHKAEFSKGYYFLLKDTLVLVTIPWQYEGSTFDIVSQSDSSQTVFGTKKIDERQILLSVDITDKGSKALEFCPVSLMSNQKVISTIISDKRGHFEYYSTEYFINSLKVDCFGYRTLLLDLEQFKGSHSEVDVFADPDDNRTYIEMMRMERFLVSFKEEEISQLISIDDNKLIYNRNQ